MEYLLVCGKGDVYKKELTYRQAKFMLELWGDQYNIDDCKVGEPIYSPSGYSRVVLNPASYSTLKIDPPPMVDDEEVS